MEVIREEIDSSIPDSADPEQLPLLSSSRSDTNTQQKERRSLEHEFDLFVAKCLPSSSSRRPYSLSFQHLLLLVLVGVSLCQKTLVYSLELLKLPPKLQCWQQDLRYWRSCEAAEACAKSSEEWRVDETSPLSLHNWVETMNLLCEEKGVGDLGDLGAYYIMAMLMGLLVFPRISDCYGRIKIVQTQAILVIVTQVGIVCTSFTLFQLQIFYFISGFADSIATCVTYNYALEFVPCDKKNFFSTSIFVGSLAAPLLYPLYFSYVSTDWLYFYIPFLVATCLCSIAIFLMPESPKYLFFQKQFEPAEQVLKWIAKFNHADQADIDFSFLEFKNLQKLAIERQHRIESRSQEKSISMKYIQKVAPIRYFSDFNYLRCFGILLCCFICTSFTLCCISIQNEKQKGNPIVNNFLFLLIQLISYFFGGLLLTKIELRHILSAFYFIAILVSLLAIGFGHENMHDHQNYILAEFLIIKFCIAATINPLAQAANQSLPTEVVATSFALCHFISTTVNLFAPSLMKADAKFPLIAFCVLCFGSSSLILKLRNKEMEMRE